MVVIYDLFQGTNEKAKLFIHLRTGRRGLILLRS